MEEARRQGKAPPEPEEYAPRDRSRDIKNPMDPDLGWNALGIRPPFLADVPSGDTEYMDQEDDTQGPWSGDG